MINYDNFFKAINEKVLEKTKRTRLDLLNNGFYCITGAITEKIRPHDGVTIMIKGKKRDEYFGKTLTEFPLIYPFEKTYAYERNYQNLLRNFYSFKKNKNVLLFEKDDEKVFDEIVKYIICSEIAEEIVYRMDFNDSYPILDLLCPIHRSQGKNMTQFSHVYLDKRVYKKLKSIDDIVNYISDLVIETMNNACLLVVIDIRTFNKKDSFKKDVYLLIDKLSSRESEINNIVNNEFLNNNMNAKLALDYYKRSLNYLKDALLEIV